MSELQTAYDALLKATYAPVGFWREYEEAKDDPARIQAVHWYVNQLYARDMERRGWPELLAVERALRALAEERDYPGVGG